jgi:hypothetical protein
VIVGERASLSRISLISMHQRKSFVDQVRHLTKYNSFDVIRTWLQGCSDTNICFTPKAVSWLTIAASTEVHTAVSGLKISDDAAHCVFTDGSHQLMLEDTPDGSGQHSVGLRLNFQSPTHS